MKKTKKNKIRICKGCGKKFKPKVSQQFFHSAKCRSEFYFEKNRDKIKRKRHIYYENNKEKITLMNAKWVKRNPEKRRRIFKKAMKKYLENNRDHFNTLQRGYYKKNKDKQLSRSRVNHLLKDFYGYKEKKYRLSKSCFICKSRYKTWLFYDIYPLTIENMIKALKQNKVRYLCRKHWREASIKRKKKWQRKQKFKKNSK